MAEGRVVCKNYYLWFMIQELEIAIKKASLLSETQQKEIAKIIVDEIGWEASFDSSQHKLLSLAEEAKQEYKAEKTKPLEL